MSRWVQDEKRTATLVQYLRELDKNVCASNYENDHFFLRGVAKPPYIPASLAVYTVDDKVLIGIDISEKKRGSAVSNPTAEGYGMLDGEGTIKLIASLTDQQAYRRRDTYEYLMGCVRVDMTTFDRVFPSVDDISAPTLVEAVMQEKDVASTGSPRAGNSSYFFNTYAPTAPLAQENVVAASPAEIPDSEENCLTKLRKAFGC